MNKVLLILAVFFAIISTTLLVYVLVQLNRMTDQLESDVYKVGGSVSNANNNIMSLCKFADVPMCTDY